MKLFTWILVLSLAVGASAQSSGLDALQSAAKKLHSLESLKAEYTLQPIGGVAETIKVVLVKPNYAYVELPNRTIVANGDKVVFYDRRQQHYFEREQTDSELAALFNYQELWMWAPFFDKEGYRYVMDARLGETRVRKGMKLREVSARFGAGNLTTLYLDSADSLPKQGEITSERTGRKVSRIFDVVSLELDKSEEGAVLAWKPPVDAERITEAELVAAGWFTDYDQAVAAAKKANKPLFVKFTMEGCRACEMLAADVFSSDEFAEKAKKYVLVSIESTNRTLVSRFNIEAYPSVFLLKPDQTLGQSFVGYRPLGEVLSLMDAVAGR